MLKKNDICTVKVTLPGRWAQWYLARIETAEDDGEGNWSVDRFQVCGESFMRDNYEGCYIINDEIKQKQALKLSATIWSPREFKTLDDVRKAILEVWL